MIQIVAVDCYTLRIPFKSKFKHHTAERAQTASVWVEIKSACGVVGYGESCPRPYVTNESTASAYAFITAVAKEVQQHIHSIADLKQWVERRAKDIDNHPAAWCAVELALLDLLGKKQQCSVESLLGTQSVRGPFRYAAVLGDGSTSMFQAQLQQYVDLGLSDFKVKVSGDVDHDQEKYALLERFGVGMSSLRIDANNLWPDWQAAAAYLSNVEGRLWAVEEPLQVADYQGMLALAERNNVKIILDESCLKHEDLGHIAQAPNHFIINIRISKMGGIIRSLNIARAAVDMGVSLIVGAQVGETSLLTRAALTVVAEMKTHVIAQEGAFGTLLLSEDVVAQPIQFGQQGVVDANAWNFDRSPGFGLPIQINQACLLSAS